MKEASPPVSDHKSWHFEPVGFAAIAGWMEDDHSAAMAAFLQSAHRMRQRAYTTKKTGIDGSALARVGELAMALPSSVLGDSSGCREFFESHFEPARVHPAGNLHSAGFVTGYYEPEIAASTSCSAEYAVPILARPDDLVEFTDADRPGNLADHFFFARRAATGLVEYHDRAAIEQGALDGRGLELFWCKSRIDLFFVQVQGSARLRMSDGSIRRISYDGKSGHPFTAIGRLLIDRGEIDPVAVSMQTIRAWLESHPDAADSIMRENRSYIFFREIDHPAPRMGPVAAAGIPLTAGRSIAVDHRLHTFGTPFFIATSMPLPGTREPFRRLMIAQDTGSAIVGPARGDLFMGSGDRAGEAAGAIRHDAVFTLLKPKPLAG